MMTLDKAIQTNNSLGLLTDKIVWTDPAQRNCSSAEWRWVSLKATGHVGYVAAKPQVGTGNVLVYIPVALKRGKPQVQTYIVTDWRNEVQLCK